MTFSEETKIRTRVKITVRYRLKVSRSLKKERKEEGKKIECENLIISKLTINQSTIIRTPLSSERKRTNLTLKLNRTPHLRTSFCFNPNTKARKSSTFNGPIRITRLNRVKSTSSLIKLANSAKMLLNLPTQE